MKRLLVLSLAIVGCAPAGLDPTAPPSPSGVASASAPATSSVPAGPPLPAELRIAAVNLPERFAADGEMGEWSVHRSAERMVYIAPAADRLVLAVSLPKAGSVSLILTTPIPRVPDLGWVSRGGGTHPMMAETCSHEQVPGPEGSWDVGKALPKEVVRACNELVERHAAFAATFYQRFVRRFVLSPDGVTMDGHRVEGARHAAVGANIEVALPLSALPRLAEAPLANLAAFASETELPDVPLPIRMYEPQHDPRWWMFQLAAPVAFEPHSVERGMVFKDFAGFGYASEATMSYHPAEPGVVERLYTSETGGITTGAYSPQRQAVVQSSAKLVAPLEELGDVSISLVMDYLIVTKKSGKVVAEQNVGNIDGIVRRNEQLHIFSYSSNGYQPFIGTYVPPAWNVIAIRKDGTIVEEITDGGIDILGDWDAWEGEPKQFHNDDFTSFGMRGTRNKRPKTITMQWDAAAQKYTSSIQPESQRKVWPMP